MLTHGCDKTCNPVSTCTGPILVYTVQAGSRFDLRQASYMKSVNLVQNS